MKLIDRLNRPPVYLPAVMAFVLVLTVVVIVEAAPGVPNPKLLPDYDVRLCTAADMADCDPELDPPPAGATVTELTDLQLGLVHHLDVDGDGTGTGNCGDFHGIGEVAGRCDDNADLTTQLFVDSSLLETAPIVRLNRSPGAIIENRDAPPTRVDLTYTVTDQAGILPDIDVGFGYATPPGGSIPTKVSSYLLGLLPPPDADADWVPFNPMTLVVDSGQFTTLSGAAPVAPTYAGPLSINGGFSMPAHDGEEAIDVDLDLLYTPLPERIQVVWERDDASDHHLTYAHDAPGTHEHIDDPTCNPLDDPPLPGCPRDVDLQARVRATSGDDPNPDLNEHFQVDARIDRLPTLMDVEVDLLTEEGTRNQGTVDFMVPTSAILPSGRLPDARFDVLSRVPNEGADADTFPVDSQVVTAQVEQMPTVMHAEWYLPEKQEVDGVPACAGIIDDLPPDVTDPCLARAEFAVPGGQVTGPFVGGVELAVANHEGDSPVLDRFLPGWHQYVNLQSAPIAPGSTRLHELLTARVERIRKVVFEETPTGFTTHTELGDGAQPLQVHVATDERTIASETEPGLFGTKMDADLLVAPLPDELDLAVQTPDEDAGRPLVVDWDASASLAPSIDIDGTLELRGAPAEDDAACGRPHTLCATFDVDHIPDVGTLTLDQGDDETLLALDTSPSVDESLDLVADVTARPCVASAPVVASIDLRRVPEHVRARALTPIVEGDPSVEEPDCAIDKPDETPLPDAPTRELGRFELQPCAYDFAARACEAGTEGAFGAITVAARNFLDRPPDDDDELLHVPIVTTPQYASAALRDAGVSIDADATEDNLFEIEARLLEVRELQFLKHDETIGARIRAGTDADGDGAGDDPFMVAFDIEDVLLDNENPDAHREDLRGHALIDPLPTDVDLCFRSPGGQLTQEAFDPITATCEDDEPFVYETDEERLGPDAPVTAAPTSFALDTSAEFSLDARLERVDRGQDPAEDARHDDETTRLELAVAPVPSDGIGNDPDLVVHFQTPEDKEEPTEDPAAESDTAVRMRFDATTPSKPIIVDFSAEILDDELFCTDPRLPDEVEPDPETGERQFQSALCMSGVIENLPTGALMIYDPETEGQNLRFAHDGENVNLVDLELTSVTATVDEGFDAELGTDDDEVVPSILVAQGELVGLPRLIKGTIVPPGTITLRSVDPDTEDFSNPDADQDGEPVDEINIVARNYIAPDPMPSQAPEQRTVDGVQLPRSEHELLVFRRDELFKAIIDVGDLVRAGFETVRDVDGNFLDTNVITVDFGQPQEPVRGYADLQYPTERDDPGTPQDEARESLAAIIGDVTLQDKPAGVQVCFRGDREFPAVPVDPTFCDRAPPDDETGALEVRMRPFDPELPERLDVDAFLRLASGGGGDVFSAAAHVDNVPLVIQGLFPPDGADVQGFDLGGNAQGIDRMTFELANFDLASEAHGYKLDDRPWPDDVPGPGWTPPEGDAEDAITFSRDPLGDYFSRIRVLNEQLFVQGAFGVIDDPDKDGTAEVADSNLQRVAFAAEPCAPATDPPPDGYPHFPRDITSDYTCVRGDFAENQGGATEPLLVELVIDEDAERLSLNAVQPDNQLARAGLTRVPRSFRATIASTATLAPDTSLRDPCGTHPQHEDDDVSCMPPVMHLELDDPRSGDPAFFGMLELGRRDHLRTLREMGPNGSIAGADGLATREGAGLGEAPDADGWANWPDGHGARVRVGTIPSGRPDQPGEEVDEGEGVIVGLHLPLTGAITVDQFQKWSCTNGAADCPDTTEQEPPGEEDPAENSDLRIRYVARDVAGAVVDTVGQLAAMIVDAKGEQILVADPDDEENLGVTLPGEFGLQMFKRVLWQPESDDKQLKRSFLQLDGRASSPIELGARIFGSEVREIDARVRGTDPIPPGDDDPLSPSFRLRAGIDKQTPVEEEEDCSFYVVFNFCKVTTIHEIVADIDFLDAARVDAFVSVDKPQNAVEIRGYDVLHGTEASGESPIDVTVSADLDIAIFVLVVLVVVNAEILAAMNISAEMVVETARQFRWRNNLLAMEAAHVGDAGGVDIDIDIIPDILFGIVVVWIPFILFATWGFVYAWPPSTGPEMLAAYTECPIGLPEFGGFSLDAGESNSVYVDPAIDPRVIEFQTGTWTSWFSKLFPNFTGVTSAAFNGVELVSSGGASLGFGGAGALLLDIAAWLTGCVIATPDLNTIADGIEVGPPVTPTGHEVPGYGPNIVEGVPPAPVEEVPNLTVDSAVELCGPQVYGRVVVEDGGTLGIATGSDCPTAGDAGSLLLAAESIEVQSGGTIDARAGNGEVSFSAGTFTVAPGGRVRGGVNAVTLTAVGLLQIDGSVTADAVNTATSVGGSDPATGNSGAGHGGAGGDGSSGHGGATYGNNDLELDGETGRVPSDPGTRGAGSSGTRGDGGGQLHLYGGRIRISGTVSASGGDATRSATDASRQCSVPDDPDTEDVDESQPNTGLAGPGGGSGGSVVVIAEKIDVTGGSLRATGGEGADGKAGGGGGGGGGMLKVGAPIYVGNSPDRSGGDGGDSLCVDDFDHGEDGTDGPVVEDRSPSSRAGTPMGMFWLSGDGLDIPVRAAARAIGTGDDFQVQLCGLHRPPEAAEAEDPEDAEQDFGIDMPDSSSHSLTNPCGSAVDDTTVHDIGRESFPNTLITDDDQTMRVRHASGDSVDITAATGNGYWGLYTVILKPATNGNDCFDRTDFSILGNGLLYDQFDCTVEALPTRPDAIIGIDNTPPVVGSAAILADDDNTVTTEQVQLSIGSVTDDMPHSSGSDVIENQSGVERVECRNLEPGAGDEDGWSRCVIGTSDWDLLPGPSGERTVEVRAFDFAGNRGDVVSDVITLDVAAPTFTATVDQPPTGNNGWYLEAPTFTLGGFADEPSNEPGNPVVYEYWFDGGTHRNCQLGDTTATDPECRIDEGVPSLGIHRLNAQAIDLAGHRSDVEEELFKVDGQPPLAELLTAPFAPDAANDWFGLQPFVVVSALDQPGGSGLEPLDDDDTTTGVFYAVDDVVDGAPAVPIDDFTRSAEIFQLDPGAHEVCYYAVDQAGNPTIGAIGSPEPACEEVLVDDELPTVDLAPDPVDGDNGWYVTPPTVAVEGDDASSGVVGNTGDQCGSLATPAGVCISSDRAPWETDPSGTTREFTTDGTHSLRAFATDVAGKRSALGVLELKVDLTDPLTTFRTQPPAPTRNGRFRVAPEVHLSAQEPHLHNSGVRQVDWCLEDNRTPASECAGPAGFTTYDGPFLVPDGDWDLQFRATDEAGRVEALRTEPVFVDTTPPTADATFPVPTPPDAYNNLTDPDATFNWTAFDELSDAVDISVLVYGSLPAVGYETLRRLEVGSVDPSPQHDGSNLWDGQRELKVGGLTTLEPVPPRPGTESCLPVLDPLCDPGPTPLVGRYWYRVVVTDEAGNVAQSDQSMYIEVKIL